MRLSYSPGVVSLAVLNLVYYPKSVLLSRQFSYSICSVLFSKGCLDYLKSNVIKDTPWPDRAYSIPTPLGPDQAYSAVSFGPVFLATVIDEHDWDLGSVCLVTVMDCQCRTINN